MDVPVSRRPGTADSDLMYSRVHCACFPALVIFCPGLRADSCLVLRPKEVPLGRTASGLFRIMLMLVGDINLGDLRGQDG